MCYSGLCYSECVSQFVFFFNCLSCLGLKLQIIQLWLLFKHYECRHISRDFSGQIFSYTAVLLRTIYLSLTSKRFAVLKSFRIIKTQYVTRPSAVKLFFLIYERGSNKMLVPELKLKWINWNSYSLNRVSKAKNVLKNKKWRM